jgi:hypothetical protein
MHHSGRSTEFNYVFETSRDSGKTWQHIGEICPFPKSGSVGWGKATSVYIDQQQNVFTQLPKNYFESMLSAHRNFLVARISGAFCSDRGKAKFPVLFEASKEKRVLGTIKDGIIRSEWLYDDDDVRYQ